MIDAFAWWFWKLVGGRFFSARAQALSDRLGRDFQGLNC